LAQVRHHFGRAARALGCCAVRAMRPLMRAACGPLLLAGAFDMDGHDAIGQTAASAMDQEAVRGMKRLLGGQDASDVAGWGHQVDDTYPGVTKLHFQAHDSEWCGAVEGRKAACEDNICLLQAIKHFYGKILADEGRKIDYPAIDYRKVEPSGKLTFSDADAVKMLINLIGDMHQPLHVGFAADDNGKSVKVDFQGKQMSLYDVWDTAISEMVRTQESGFWYGGWTHVRSISGQFQKDKETWKKEGAMKAFDVWFEEQARFACDKAYKHPVTGKALAGPAAEASPARIDRNAYQAMKQNWLNQLLIAGERTAIVLNDILDAAEAKKLSARGGVVTNADEEKKKQEAEWAKERDKNLAKEKATSRASSTTPFRVVPSIALTNFAIACAVVPIFLLIANHGLDPRCWATLVKMLLEKDGDAAGAANGGGGPTKRWE